MISRQQPWLEGKTNVWNDALESLSNIVKESAYGIFSSLTFTSRFAEQNVIQQEKMQNK